MSNLTDFLSLSYGELEDLNLGAKEQRAKRVPLEKVQEERLKYLTDEKKIKAVTVMFSDLEVASTCSITTRSFSSRTPTT